MTHREVINGITLADNVGLVWTLVNRYRGLATVAYDTDDMFSEGFLGLVRAAETYDSTLGAFSTHAFWWIRQNVLRGVSNQSRTVRVPCHRLEQHRAAGTSPARTLSLDATMGEDGAAYVDRLSYEDETDPAELHDHRVLESMLSVLDTREQAIVRARFWGERTLSDIGRDFGVTRERIRQLEAIAIKKLRAQMAQESEG